MTQPSPVRDNAAEHRFEITVDGDTAFAEYRIDGDVITFTHTVVPPAIDGQGVGTRLIEAALAGVGERGLKVDPQCAFVRHYLDEHPEAATLA